MIKVDEKDRSIYFMACGTQPENPYFAQFFKISFDGKNLTLLSPGAGTHSISLSPSENYFIDSYSKPDVPSVTVLRDMNGKQITELEKTDVSRLKAAGWKPPTPFSVKSADGKDDIYGIMFTPTNLDPNRKYPVLVYVYGGPHAQLITNSWNDGASLWMKWMAEQGYLVFTLDGRGSANRGFAFESVIHRNVGTEELKDQLVGVDYLKSLPYVDADRLAIHGWSFGGFMTVSGFRGWNTDQKYSCRLRKY